MKSPLTIHGRQSNDKYDRKCPQDRRNNSAYDPKDALLDS
jgi:hypothetical protein